MGSTSLRYERGSPAGVPMVLPLAGPPLEMVEEWTLPQYLGYIRTWSGVA